jgi:hypothetical protein
MVKSSRRQLVGTWRFVSTHLQRGDGSKTELYGPNPNGILIFTSDGYFALTNTRPGRPRFASGNTMEGTAEEYMATVKDTVAYFGTYVVDEANATYSIHIEGSSFPNYEKTTQRRPFTIAGDTLTFVNPVPTISGSVVHATLKRAK